MSFFRGSSRQGTEGGLATTRAETVTQEVLHDGSLGYTVAQAENDSPPSYQEASGAPVETKSPLGYSVGPVTIVFLNISMMIGTGVYSTREAL